MSKHGTAHPVMPPQPAGVPGEGATLSPDNFRALLGTDGRTTSGISAPRGWCSWMPRWMRIDHREPHDAMAIYQKILREEKMALRQLYAFNMLVYTCLILQLAIASTLVILSAISGDHHIIVAILGSITALTTGVLSLVKGQGQPMRLLNYADNLKKVRDDIEFCDSGLRAEVTTVTYEQVMDIWNKYTAARDSQMKNRPDVWAPEEGPSRTTDTE